MNLIEYYKTHLYDYAYNCGYNDAKKGNQDHIHSSKDIYWNDEMDYYICSDYHDLYIGCFEEWSNEEVRFLNALGFETSDFDLYNRCD